MAQKPKSKRQRISFKAFMKRFDTEKKAIEHFEKLRWHNCRYSPRCDSVETREASHKTMPY